LKTNPSFAALEDAAIALLTERDDGFSPAREREFAQWLRADPRHAATVARLEQTLGLLGELPAFRTQLNTAFDRAAPIVPFPPITAPAVRPTRRWPRAFAWTSLAAALALGSFLGWQALRPPAAIHYTTTVAGYERARLDDGSTLELNAASAARVQFTPAERRVNLEAGEAHFAVAHDTARPFIVTAGGVSVRAVGTAFSVRLGNHGVEVLVTEGKVEITRDDADSTPAPALPAAHPLLVAGERTVILRDAANTAAAIERVSTDALQAAVRWHSQVMTFTNLPLRDAVTLFNRRNTQQLILADAALGERKIGGTFAADQVEAFVRLLAQDGDITAERRAAAEIILRRAP